MKIVLNFDYWKVVTEKGENITRITLYNENEKETFYPNEAKAGNTVSIPNVKYIKNDRDRINEMKALKQNFYCCLGNSYCDGKTYELYIYVDGEKVKNKEYVTCIEEELTEWEKKDPKCKHTKRMDEVYKVKLYDGEFTIKRYSHTLFDAVYRQAEILVQKLDKLPCSYRPQIEPLIYLIDKGMLNVGLEHVLQEG